MGVDAASRVQLCGRFLVRYRGERIEDRLPGRQGRQLFAYLLTHEHRAATRDELIEALWPSELPSAPDMALSALLSKLRRLLGEEAIYGRADVHLRMPLDAWVDVEAAREQTHLAESMIALERWEEGWGPAMVARFITERPFMRSEEAPWIDEVRRELADLRLRAVECDARLAVEIGGKTENSMARRSARQLVELAPYRESAHCLLMRTLAQEGDFAEALRVYERLRRRLRDELGTSPSAEAQALHAEMLAGGG